LLSNAIKFTPEHGKIKLSARVFSVDHANITLQVEVSDNGIGIPKDQQQEIFNIFTQVDGGLTRKQGGVGLGLPISKHIVEMMGGKLSVESELGEGAKFIFTSKMQTG